MSETNPLEKEEQLEALAEVAERLLERAGRLMLPWEILICQEVITGDAIAGIDCDFNLVWHHAEDAEAFALLQQTHAALLQ